MGIIKFVFSGILGNILKPYLMEISILAAIITGGIIIGNIINKKKSRNNGVEEEKDGKHGSGEYVIDTRGLMISTLSSIGCQPTANDDGSVSVQYQGENFHMEFGGIYARVWDPMWASVRMDDPNLPKIREAMNATNFNFGPTVVMTRPDDNGVIRLHSRRDIMLHPACPNNDHFVKAVLDSFFSTKDQLRNLYQQLNATQQTTVQSPRRPVGFTANPES